MRARVSGFAAAAFAVAVVTTATAFASAAQLVVAPVALELTPQMRSGTIDLTNRAEDPLRVEITALDWEMDAAGNAAPTPASAIVVFPHFLTIPPHETRRLRAATLTAERGPIEKAYRLSVAEIPVFAGPDRRPGVNITFRTTYLLGVYLAPTVERHAAVLANAAVRRGRIGFDLRDDGSVHERIPSAAVTLLGSDGKTVATLPVDPTLVLAGRTRSFSVAPTAAQCAATRAARIDATVGAQSLSQTIDVRAADCAP